MKTLSELKKSNKFELEMAHSNYEDFKYHLYTKNGYQYDTDSEQHLNTFETVEDMLYYVKHVGIVKCPEDCCCK